MDCFVLQPIKIVIWHHAQKIRTTPFYFLEFALWLYGDLFRFFTSV